MQRLANGALASEKLTHHAFDLLAKASLVEVQTENVVAAIELVQAAPVLIGLANLEWGDYGLQFAQHGVGRWFEGRAIVLNAL